MDKECECDKLVKQIVIKIPPCKDKTCAQKRVLDDLATLERAHSVVTNALRASDSKYDLKQLANSFHQLASALSNWSGQEIEPADPDPKARQVAADETTKAQTAISKIVDAEAVLADDLVSAAETANQITENETKAIDKDLTILAAAVCLDKDFNNIDNSCSNATDINFFPDKSIWLAVSTNTKNLLNLSVRG